MNLDAFDKDCSWLMIAKQQEVNPALSTSESLGAPKFVLCDLPMKLDPALHCSLLKTKTPKELQGVCEYVLKISAI
jgi:hypothetical protein